MESLQSRLIKMLFRQQLKVMDRLNVRVWDENTSVAVWRQYCEDGAAKAKLPEGIEAVPVKIDGLPEGLAAVMRYNPMAWYAGRLRDFLLHGDFSLGPADAVVPLMTVLLFVFALAFFRRFSTHFEDFL